MIEKWTDLSKFLTENHVTSSTPTRLDCGGSTDHRLTALICKNWQPATANITIDLRAHVSLRPHRPGLIVVDIDGVGQEEFTAPHLPLTGPFALVSGLICYFGVHGLYVDISTEFPFQSGLGGSGAIAIALIAALSSALCDEVPHVRNYPGMVQLAHNLEDSLFGNTGMQDQAAALYGGANLWEWEYGDRLNFSYQQLVPDLSSLDDHILLAYSGRPHLHSQDGIQMLARFKEKGALDIFALISDKARKFAESLKCEDYRSAGEFLTAEQHLRSTLLPEAPPEDLELIEMATNEQCGVKVTGRGGGGCLWAVGEKKNIENLKKLWTRAFKGRKAGFVLPVKATATGLEVSIKPVTESQTSTRRIL